MDVENFGEGVGRLDGTRGLKKAFKEWFEYKWTKIMGVHQSRPKRGKSIVGYVEKQKK
jgi:hypothetical protein